MKKTVLILLMFFGQNSLFAQTKPNEVKICDTTISFNQNCIAHQSFQGVKSDDFDLMWLYLENQPGIEGTSISQNKDGYIIYKSDFSIDQISRRGFSIYPKKNDEVIYTPTIFKVLGKELSGYIIEIRKKKSSLFYLTVCGNLCERNVGIQVKLNENVSGKIILPDELKKIIEIKD